MSFKLPWSNFHELNLDWLLNKMKELSDKVDEYTGSAVPSNDPPLMDDTASAGNSVNYARGDHVHPTDTSRASQLYAESIETKVDNLEHNTDIAIREINNILNFSTAAPVVDGVANPGSSQYPARADHVHPTDTSRASKDDFDTLKARVDAFSGSANPSDTVPNMDGIGSAGIGGNYSRGDHVHPSDTSKLSLSGGTLTGFVDSSYHTSYFNNSAVGWRRVAYVPIAAGTDVEISVIRAAGSVSEDHSILLTIPNDGSDYIFDFERSRGAEKKIDKIRYTDAGAIDIHFDSATASDISVSIIPKNATRANAQVCRVYENPESVMDAPDGETILTEYSFYINSVGLIIATPQIQIAGLVQIYGRRVLTSEMAHYSFILKADSADVNISANSNIMTGLVKPSPVTWYPIGHLTETGAVRLGLTSSGALTAPGSFTVHYGAERLLIDMHYPIVH